MSALAEPRYTLAEAIAVLSDPTDTAYQTCTGLGTAVKDFQAHQRIEKRRSEATVRGYNGHLRALALAYPAKGPQEITPQDLRRQLATIQSLAMRAQAHAAFSSFFRWLYREEQIDRSPMDRVDIANFQPVPLDPRELFDAAERAALAAQSDPYDRLGVELILRTGMRPFEQRALQVRDVDLVNRRLIIRHGKGGKPGVAQFSESGSLHRALLLHLHTEVRLRGGRYGLLASPTDYLLHKRDGNHWQRWHIPEKPLSGSAYNQWWRKVCANAQVRYRKPYIGRHTFGTELARRGARPEVIKDAMRHASIQTTYKHYIRTSEEDVLAAVTLLEDED